MCWLKFVLFLCASVSAQNHVSVVILELQYGQPHTLTVNSSVEYLVDFVAQTDEERSLPSRVLLMSDGGDEARPVIITARQRTGAEAWQLPYRHEGLLLFEIERTLCPRAVVGAEDTPANCDVPEDNGGTPRAGFSLHIGSACAVDTRVTLRAEPVTEWRLAYQSEVTVHVTQAAPRVAYYEFSEGQESVRLVVKADDDACATVSVQNYTCPIAQSLDEIGTRGLRMTVERSGGVQLSRSSYPNGFLVVAIVRGSDTLCRGEEEEQEWLWNAALFGEEREIVHLLSSKDITFNVQPALSRGQYAAAAAATVAVFAGFYIAFGAMLLARRWPPLRRRIGSKAVLAPQENETASTQVDSTSVVGTPARRRDSTATFDSSNDSDTGSDSEGPGSLAAPSLAARGASTPVDHSTRSPTAHAAHSPTVNTVTGASISTITHQLNGDNSITDFNRQPETSSAAVRPFGLPATLRLDALARRRSRVLRARSDRYLHTLYTVAVFYALPVVQFVAAFQVLLNVSGSLDICYYNFLCAHPAGALTDFNHVFSNVGYLLLGALLLAQVAARRRRRRAKPRHEEYGIPAHYGLLSALGAGMMVVALLSASYHVCPNQLNFQFDVAFMYVLAVLSMVKIYQARHPDVNARAHATFGVLAVLIALVVWGVLGGGPLFWGVFTVLHVFTFLLLSLRIYYVGQFRLEKASLAEAARGLRGAGGPARPLYGARMILLLIANAVNWAFALYGLFTQAADFASHLLNVLLCNTLLYMLFYLTMKLLHGERPRWYAWCYLVGAMLAWAPGLYFFLSGSTNWAATPARSRHLNHECMVMEFYDAHDLWHLLSAAALYLSFSAMMTWDDGLAAVRRADIAVF